MEPNISRPEYEKGLMVYPGQSKWLRLLWRAPITLWRLGLGFTIPHQLFLLTTHGRKSGLPRRVVLECSDLDGRLYFISAWGTRAQWYQNILADPRITVQNSFYGLLCGTAQRVMDDHELESLYWKLHQSPFWYEYLQAWNIGDRVDEILANKDRLIILRLEPDQVKAPPPQPADLAWIWFWSGGLFLGYWLFSCLRKRLSK